MRENVYSKADYTDFQSGLLAVFHPLLAAMSIDHTLKEARDQWAYCAPQTYKLCYSQNQSKAVVIW
jgi:hypothetical protein